MIRNARIAALAIIVGLLVVTGAASAAAVATSRAPAKPSATRVAAVQAETVTIDGVAGYIRQLGSENYAEREAAGKALAALGEKLLAAMPTPCDVLAASEADATAAIVRAKKLASQAKAVLLTPLAQAADGGDPERATRANEIGKQFEGKFAGRVATLNAVRSGEIDLSGLADAGLVLIGKVTGVRRGPTGLSRPPVHTGAVTVVVESVLRGAAQPGQVIQLRFSRRQTLAPEFPSGQRCLVAATEERGRRILGICKPLTPVLHASAVVAAQLPLGWQFKAGKCFSPWAKLGAAAWPKGLKSPAASMYCSKTGRPALLLGTGVTLTVEKVPPPKAIKWTNPDGDGEYTVTVTNTTGKEVAVPALLNDGEKILWAESLLVGCQGIRMLPAAKGLADTNGLVPTKLAPGQKVSTVVNAFTLPGKIEWPRGGYRVSFQFCLGEQAATKSFYYLSRHHDKVRAAVVKAMKGN